MGVDLAGGRRLLLAGGEQALWWLAVGAVTLGLLLVLYRYERRLVARRTGLTLLGLRMAAALALVAFLFEPIAARTYRETVRGRVVVGVDLSDSMATADPTRSPDDRQRLAQVLDLSPAEPVEALSRRTVARRLIRGEWLRRIATAHDVELLGFARDAVPGSMADPGALWSEPEPGARVGSMTDWSAALAAGLRGTDEAPVVAVVLLTDGRQNAPNDPSGPLADRLASRGVPVYPVLIGSTVPPRDAAIAAIKSSESVYQGDVAVVEVTIKADAPPGTELPVTLEIPGGSPQHKTARATSDGSRPVVTFRVPMEAVGSHTLTAAVGPLEGDVRPDNDRRDVTIQVADDKARVLLVESEARWEFRYLRNALARDPRVGVEAVVLRQPAAETTSPTFAKTLPAKPEPMPEGQVQPDPLGSFDAIVLGDVATADLTPEGWERLDRYVAERGGTLIVSPGPENWPGLLATSEIARRLVPVLDPQPVPFDPQAADPERPTLPAGVTIAPMASADADAWPMLQFAAEPDRSRAAWSALPRLPWVLAGKAKPGATVLVSVAGDVAATSAVIAAQPYGLGKVLWVGTDATWRWRFRVGDAYHHRFWGQTVRWAASEKLAAGNRLVRFGPDRSQLPEGEGVRLQARFVDEARNVGPELLVAARVFPKGDEGSEAVAVVPLRAVAGQPRTFEGNAPALPVGAYVVRLDAPQLAEALQAEGPIPEAPLEVTPRDTSERVELAAARDPLDRLASATSGKVFPDVDAADLLALLSGRTVERTRTVETSLWDQPYALGLFFALLTVEWVMRKRVGLP